MKIAVAYKWAPDPQDASVAPDGTLDWTRGRPGISDYDATAIEIGRLLSAELGAELIGLSVGGPDAGLPAARKAALSRGLDRLMLVADERSAGLDALASGQALAVLARQAGADLVLTGDASLDAGSRIVGPVLAGVLGWTPLASVSAVARSGLGWRVERRVSGGVQVIEGPGPLMLSVTPDAVQPPVPGMRDILAAAKKPVDEMPFEALGLGVPRWPEVGRGRPVLPVRERRIIDGSDADAAASAVVAFLAERGIEVA